jgi:hypothetical protein
LNFLIPLGTWVDDLWVQYDTTNLRIGDDYIREYEYKIFLNGEFQRNMKPGDTIVYNPGEICLIGPSEY